MPMSYPGVEDKSRHVSTTAYIKMIKMWLKKQKFGNTKRSF